MSEHDGGGSVAETQALPPAERAELEALRAEVVKLRERPERAPRHRMSWRTPVATLLIVIGCLLAPISVLGVWAAHQEIVAALSGRTNGNGAITVSNGQVTVGLAPFIDIAKQDLAARGLTIV